MRKITLASNLHLPLEAVTQTFAVLGKRGSGKTNTSGVMTEQMIKAGLPVVVVDPIGVWWGLRHAADGKSPGLPVVILGGEHADVPIDESSGTVIADFVIEHRTPVVIDLGLLSKSAQRRFMVDFAERLYVKNRNALHVVLDECDTFVPQRIDHGGERLVGAINDLVRKGRARGIGVTLISQRPALVNKDVLTQIEVLVAHRMTGPQDRDAIERWVEHNADKDPKFLASLQVLEIGEAWVWSPGWLELFKKTRINLRTTFDSSATPKAGTRVRTPKNAARVDLESLKTKLATTIERAKEDDPRELRRQIAELEKQLRTKTVVQPPPPKPVEVPVLTSKERKAIEQLTKATDGFAAAVDKLNQRAQAIVSNSGTIATACAKLVEKKPALPKPQVAPASAARIARTANGASNGTRRKHHDVDANLDGPMRKILAALAQFGPMDKKKLALLSGYSSTGGAFNNPLGRLRSEDNQYITPKRVEPIAITQRGLDALGDYEQLPGDSDALFDLWMQHSSVDGPMRRILAALREAGGSLDKVKLAARCEYEPTGGAFNNPLGRLRRLGLISKSGAPTLVGGLI